LLLKDAGADALARLETHRDLITGLARLSSAGDSGSDAPDGAVQDVLDEATIILPLADVIDVAGEKARLEKEIARLAADIAKFDEKLANREFLAKAPMDVVEKEKERRADAEQARAKLDAAHGRLAGA
jgi:valyl-tRNA synthetase